MMTEQRGVTTDYLFTVLR